MLARRAAEISRIFGAWLAVGHGAFMLTLTVRHHRGDSPAQMVELVNRCLRRVTGHRRYRELREQLGVLGYVRAFEITYGENGPHPHFHLLFATMRVLSGEAALEFWSLVHTLWDEALGAEGFDLTKTGVGVKLDLVGHERDARAVGLYVAKLQEGGSLANEIARGDLKMGRNLKRRSTGGRTPFEVLADGIGDGDMADLALWQQHVAATKGVSSVRWSRGLKARMQAELGEEAEADVSDADLASQDVGGKTVAEFDRGTWWQVTGIPGGEARVLEAAERGGLVAIREYLESVGIDPCGASPPDG